jgi:hypothetical protein
MKARKLIGAAVVTTAVIGIPTAALAQTDDKTYVGTTQEVKGVEFERTPEPAKVLGVQESQDTGALPVTGGDLVGMVLFGAGAVAVGTVLVRRSRTASVTA